ncbi:MAG TPA: hypothetical protein VGJ55_04110 [Pyrinomonadaceae bacterium]
MPLKLFIKREHSKWSATRVAIGLFLLCTLASSQISCLGPKRTPALDRIFAQARERKGKRPIIVIPGILGSELVDEKSGEVAWPSAVGSLAASLTLPLSPNLAANRDNLYPRRIISSVKLARLVPEVYVYRGLLDALKQYGGYAEGDWNNPPPEGDRDTFYVFAYDWRRDNVESARELVQRLESLKRKLNRPDLKFNIVAHSMGGLIARYAAMYGDTDLPADSLAPSPTWAGAAHINRIVMFGVPNEGSADAFATILRGYSLTEGLRPQIRLFNTFSKEVAFSSPSVFQLMPHAAASRFLDENFKPLPLDLYDVATWKLYGWTPADTGSQKEVGGGDGELVSGGRNPQNRDEYLAAVLQRAKRFHEALDAPATSDAPVALLSFGGDCEDTLEAPLILRDSKKGRWITLTTPRSFRTSDGRRVSKSAAIAAMYVPGDGRVTRRSLLAEDLQSERRAGSLFNAGLPIAYSVFGCDLHGNLQNNAILQDNALTALISEVVR